MLNKSVFASCFILIAALQMFAQKTSYFSFDEAYPAATVSDQISSTSFDVVNHFNKPSRIPGVKNNALRLDGWSTWASASNYSISGISNQITFEIWYATESFTAATSALVSQDDLSSKGFSLEVGSFGTVSLTFTADNTRYTINSSSPIEKYKWNHIVCTVDLAQNVSRIYINGKLNSTKNLPTHSALTFYKNTFYIGRHTRNTNYAGFLTTAANGAVDELSVYNTVLDSSTINTNYSLYQNAVPDLHIDPKILYQNDFLRPQYHPIPNSNWTNEPYGLVFYKNKYHLFSQKNPNGPYLYFMHWGHFSSPDLVNWTEEKLVLGPGLGFDNFGVWSGTTILDSTHKPVIVYTGVDGAKAGIGIATPSDSSLINWTKSPLNAVIKNQPAGYNSMDFRDPYVWKDPANGNYYMMVGSGVSNSGGGLLFTFRSRDLKTWTTLSPMFRDFNSTRSGTFWEMPSFIQLKDNIYLLQVTPVPTATSIAQTIYWIGTWQNEKFTPFNAQPKNFELINGNMLAPAIGVDSVTKSFYIGIVPEDRSTNDQIAAGWRQVLSLPRQIRLLQDSTIGQVPHPNLCRLRGGHVNVLNKNIAANTNNNLPGFEGNQMELMFKIKTDSTAKFSIQLYKNQDLQEFTSLIFDVKGNAISLDKRNSTLSNASKTIKTSTYMFNPQDTLIVNAFLDHSTLEVFINHIVVFSCRVYPSRTSSNLVDLVVNAGEVALLSLDKWDMDSTNKSVAQNSCEIANLPQALNKPRVVTSLIYDKHNDAFGLQIFPNPANESIQISFTSDLAKEQAELNIYSCDGVLHLSRANIKNNATINLMQLRDGIYFGELKTEKYSSKFKLVIKK